MKAARYNRHGDPDVLGVGHVPGPHAGPGSVLVTVEAASANPIDHLLRAGQLRDVLLLPAIPGRDTVRVVDEIGPAQDTTSPTTSGHRRFTTRVVGVGPGYRLVGTAAIRGDALGGFVRHRPELEMT